MRGKKKGAIELSMSTIIIVVIGIALLVVGFAFLDKIKGFLTDGTEDIFEKAQSEIKNIGDLDKPVTISPKSISLTRGEGQGVTVYLYNMGTTEATVKPEVKQSAIGTLKSSGVRCDILDSDPITIQSGGMEPFDMNIRDVDNVLTGGDVYACTVTASGDSLGLDSSRATISISVE